VLQRRPNTFAQTILSLSFFACDKAADHTFRFAVTWAQSPEALDVESALAVALRHDKEECMRNGRAFLFALTIFILSAATELYPADKNSLELSRDSIIRIVTQIQRADYEGDRPALKSLHDELTQGCLFPS
jgi:hypothetical protein